jgi:hypothetical protein
MNSRSALILAIVISLAACSEISGTDEYKISRAERAVATHLSDPASARFTAVRVTETGAVCGRVSGEGRSGARIEGVDFYSEADPNGKFSASYANLDDPALDRSCQFRVDYDRVCRGVERPPCLESVAIFPPEIEKPILD